METESLEMKEKILAGVNDLPPMPDVVVKAHALLADSDSSPKELAELLETDQSIATKVLKMANSAFFGMIIVKSKDRSVGCLIGW